MSQPAQPTPQIAQLGEPEPGYELPRVPGLEFERYEDLATLVERGRSDQPRVCLVCAGARDSIGETVRAIRRELPLTDVVLWTPGGDAEEVRQAFLAGARDAVVSGNAAELLERVHEVVEDQILLPRMLDEDRTGGVRRFGDLLSRSRTMWDVFETSARTATTDASVLILGETGTGKELLAREIHRRSGREGAFVPINCGAVPDTLIDSELFGHVEGAFTGARKSKAGLFRHAEGGTLFLDEIGSIPMEAQNRLMRALQEGVVRPVGGHDEVAVDARVIAATSIPLEQEIEEQRFRDDLFYRIDVIRLILPPLCHRLEDLILFLGRFIHESSSEYSVQRPEISEEFLDRVCNYTWPGNVRELENFVERLVLTHPGERVTERHFEGLMRNYSGREEGRGTSSSRTAASADPAIELERPLHDLVNEAGRRVELRYLQRALEESRGRVAEAARVAGIHRRTLLRKMRLHGLDKRDFR